MPSPVDLGSGRFANKGFRHTADIADALTWIVLLALAVVVMGTAVWAQSQLSNPESLASQNGLTANQIWTGSIVMLVLFYALVAPAVMLGLWLTSLIFKFKLPGGSYLRSAAVAALPAVLILGYAMAIATHTLPQNPVVALIVVALAVPLAAVLARGSFGLNGMETIVAALIAAPLGAAALFVDSNVTRAAMAAGVSPNTVAMTPNDPPQSVSTPNAPSPRPMSSPMVVTGPIRSTPSSPETGTTITESLSNSNTPTERDQVAVQQLRVDAESFIDTEITPSRIGFLRSHLASLRSRVADVQSRLTNDVTLATVAHELDDFQLKLDAPAPPPQVAVETPRPSPTFVPPSSVLPTPVPPPASLDPIDQALATLNSGNVFAKKDALKTFADTPPDPTRSAVTRQLETLVLADDAGLREPAAAALANWADSITVLKLLPWLDQSSPPWHVESAMKILSPTHDKRAVLPILLWLVKKPEPATAALIELGPVAEDDLDKAVRDPSADGRKYAARVLQEIGGQKSLIPLQKASGDSRDVEAQQAAKIALEIVRERYKQSKTGGAKP